MSRVTGLVINEEQKLMAGAHTQRRSVLRACFARRGGNLMTGSDRRNAITERIRNSAVPVSGRALAAEFDVSRQVIVQDIALIRAAGYDIISTNRGYIINEPCSVAEFHCGSGRKSM